MGGSTGLQSGADGGEISKIPYLLRGEDYTLAAADGKTKEIHFPVVFFT